MKPTISHSIPEHLRLILSNNAIIDMRAGSQIVVDTSRNRLNAQIDRLLTGHVVLVFCLEDCHRVQRTRTHSRERQVGIAESNHWYFPSALSMTRCPPKMSNPPTMR